MRYTRLTNKLVLWFVIFPSILALSIFIPYTLYLYNIMDKNFAIIFGFVLFFALIFIQRQIDLYHHIANLERELSKVQDKQVSHKMLENYVEQLKEYASSSFLASERKHENTQSQLNTVDDRLFSLEQFKHFVEMNGLQKTAGHHNTVPSDNVPSDNNEQSSDGSENEKTDHAIVPEWSQPLAPLAHKADAAQSPLNIEFTEESLTFHLQPVVKLPQRTPKYFETILRLQTAPRQYLNHVMLTKLIDNGGLWPMIDKKKLFSAPRLLEKLNNKKRKDGLICSLSLVSLSDENTYHDVFNFLNKNKDLHKKTTLSFAQKDVDAFSQEARIHLTEIKNLGYHFCMEQIHHLKFDPAHLEKMGFNAIKVPAHILLGQREVNDHDSIAVEHIVERCGIHGITVIVDQVECEEDALALLDFDIELAQGTIFARSRAIKPELLNAPEIEAETEPA